jgi:sugar phosphate isomerase/epimerase
MISSGKLNFECTRRSLLKIAGLGTVGSLLFNSRFSFSAKGIPIALQLYSIRDESKKDFDAALSQVAQMGFAAVEFAGYFNYEGKPAELKKRLDSLKLKVAGTHIQTPALQSDAIQKTIDFHREIGCSFLIVPTDKDAVDPAKNKAFADTLNKAAETLKKYGMACGYHNHAGEMKKDGDKTFWEIFAERTTKDVILQQDCGWTRAAGRDPSEFINKYPGRTRSVHFKPTVLDGDAGKKPILGQDSLNWVPIYKACASVGGTKWIVLEQEKYLEGVSSVECTRQSLAGLKKMIAGL